MHHRSKHRRWIFSFVVVIMALTVATPVLAEYIGPNRTVTETSTVCKVVLYECQFVAEKNEWKYKQDGTWSCSLESKPWQAYSSNKHPCNDTLHTDGYQYWEREYMYGIDIEADDAKSGLVGRGRERQADIAQPDDAEGGVAALKPA